MYKGPKWAKNTAVVNSSYWVQSCILASLVDNSVRPPLRFLGRTPLLRLKTMKIINLTKTLWNTLQNLITWCVGLKLKESLWKWSWILAFWTTALIPPESTVPMTNIVSNPPKIIIVNTKSVHKTRVLPVRKKKIRLWSFCWSLSFLSCLYLTDF